MRGSSLAGLYGLARLVRFICVVVVGALVVGQSKFEREFPPSPKGDGFFSGSCFAVAGVGALVAGQSRIERESPLSVPSGHLSPQGRDYFLFVGSVCVCYFRGGRLWRLCFLSA